MLKNRHFTINKGVSEEGVQLIIQTKISKAFESIIFMAASYSGVSATFRRHLLP